MMSRFLYGFIVLGGTLLGAILAYQVDAVSLGEVPGFTGYADPRMLLAILLGGLGYLVSATLTWELEKWVELQLPQIKLKDVLIGSAGLAFGFAVAGVILIPLHLFFSSDPIQGLIGPQLHGVMILIAPIVLCLCGYLGLSLFLRKGQEVVTLVGGVPVANSRVLDTSVIIDGRIMGLVESGLIEGKFIIHESVISELQHISDSPDSDRRSRGRRGLDAIDQLRWKGEVEVTIVADEYPGIQEVDDKLVMLTRDTGSILFTIDANLHKVASIKGVRSVNLNEVANALRPLLAPDDTVDVTIAKVGKERGQGVGYLNDGSMVVVERGASLLGEVRKVRITRVLKTSAGRMIFAVCVGEHEEEPPLLCEDAVESSGLEGVEGAQKTAGDSEKVGMKILKQGPSR